MGQAAGSKIKEEGRRTRAVGMGTGTMTRTRTRTRTAMGWTRTVRTRTRTRTVRTRTKTARRKTRIAWKKVVGLYFLVLLHSLVWFIAVRWFTVQVTRCSNTSV